MTFCRKLKKMISHHDKMSKQLSCLKKKKRNDPNVLDYLNQVLTVGMAHALLSKCEVEFKMA